MTEIYNLTVMSNVHNLGEMAVATNTILGGYFFGYFILGMVWFITMIFVRSKQWNTSAAAIIATWFTGLIAMFIYPVGLLDNYTFWVVIVLAALMVPVAMLRNRVE